MPENMHYLSDSDVKILKDWIYQGKGQVRRVRQEEETGPKQAPAVYIALPPLAGIPALTRASEVVGTGSGSSDVPSEGDRPGVAECTIAMITNSATTPRLTALYESATQLVYNISDIPIGYDWIQINRDRFGRWLGTPAFGGASTNIQRGRLTSTLVIGSKHSPSSAVVKLWTFSSITHTWSESSTIVTVYEDGMLGTVLDTGTWIQLVRIGTSWFYDGHNCTVTGTGST